MIADEYAIDPRRFAKVLREQRSSRMKGGIYHLTQIAMAYNSNKIEGSQLSSEQTRYIYETRTIAGDDVNVDDIIETVLSKQGRVAFVADGQLAQFQQIALILRY